MRSLGGLVARLRPLLRRGREDPETEMELRFHLEMEAQKNRRAGLPPREADRQARVRLGGIEAIREAVRDARGTRPLEDLARDLGYALRAARRSPVFTLAAVVSLAIPIGFNTTVFTVVDAVLFRPLPVVRPAQLVDVYTGLPERPYTTTSYPDYLDLRAENDAFADMAAHAPMLAVAWADENTSFVLGETVTGNYFDLLGIRPALGRLLAPADDDPAAPRVAVISSRLWDRLFGRDPDVVGRTLRVRARAYVVVGVAPPEFAGMPPIPGPDLWVPMAWVEDLAPFGISTLAGPRPQGETRLEHRGYRWMFVKGRLRDGVSVPQAAANLDVLMADLAAAYPETNEDQQLSLTLTNDVRLPPHVGEPVSLAATGLMLAVGVVLLVACANVMGMLLARSVARRREIAVRLAIGASRRRLVRQLLTEGLLLSAFGAVAGVAMAWTLLRWIAIEAPEPLIPFALGFVIDARAFLFTAAAATGAGVLAALVPALQATRLNLLRDLNGAVPLARGGRRRWFLRDALVAAQLAVTVPLMVLAAASIRGAAGSTKGTALGFDPDRVALVSTNLGMLGYDAERRDRFLRDALDRVQAMPGVEAAALTTRPPLDLSFSPARVLVPDHHGPADRGASIVTVEVTRDYFRTLGVPLLRGRTFTTVDTPESPRVAVVSEAMARRFWPEGAALAQRFRLDDWNAPEVEVVGVSADYKVQFPTEAPAPYLHLAASQRTRLRGMLLARTAGDAGVLAADINRELRRSEPDLIFTSEAGTLRETVDVTVLPFRVAASVAGASGIVAAVLGVIGLYGVIAFLVVRRTEEMAIRSALGARPGVLLRHVLAAGGWVVALGLGSGAALAFLVMRIFAQIAAGIATSDPVVWASVPLLLVVVCAVAFVVPALRIVRLDVPRALQVP